MRYDKLVSSKSAKQVNEGAERFNVDYDNTFTTYEEDDYLTDIGKQLIRMQKMIADIQN